MASIALLIGGAVVNALAFTGSNFLFSQLKPDSAALAEKERHDRALEDFQQAQAEYSRERQEKYNLMNQRLVEEKHAENTFRDVDAAIRRYNDVYSEDPLYQLGPPPKFEDFYTPSDSQRLSGFIFVGVAIAGTYLYMRHGGRRKKQK